MVDPANLGNGRQFAACCGLAPYHTGTGGKVSVLGIPGKGNRVLKRVPCEASPAPVPGPALAGAGKAGASTHPGG